MAVLTDHNGANNPSERELNVFGLLRPQHQLSHPVLAVAEENVTRSEENSDQTTRRTNGR